MFRLWETNVKMKEEEWVARLYNELQGSDMLSSRNAFPDGKQGNSFINKAQQRICYIYADKTSSIFTPEQGWELLWRKAFHLKTVLYRHNKGSVLYWHLKTGFNHGRNTIKCSTYLPSHFLILDKPTQWSNIIFKIRTLVAVCHISQQLNEERKTFVYKLLLGFLFLISSLFFKQNHISLLT